MTEEQAAAHSREGVSSRAPPHFHIIINMLPGIGGNAQTRIAVPELEAKTLLRYNYIPKENLRVKPVGFQIQTTPIANCQIPNCTANYLETTVSTVGGAVSWCTVANTDSKSYRPLAIPSQCLQSIFIFDNPCDMLCLQNDCLQTHQHIISWYSMTLADSTDLV